MGKRVWLVLLLILTLVTFTACDDDDDDGGGGGVSPEFSNEAIGSVIGSNVLLAFGAIDLALDVFFQNIPLSAENGGGPACSTVECTDGGSVEFCYPEKIGLIAVDATFSACIEGPFTFDGTYGGGCINSKTISCEIDLDLSIGTTVPNVGQIVVQLFGGLTNTYDGVCDAITRSNYGLSVAGNSTSMTGSMEWCGDDEYPTGHKEVVSISQVFGDYEFDMDFDGTSTIVVDVYDHTNGNLLGSCLVDYDTGVSNCDPV